MKRKCMKRCGFARAFHYCIEDIGEECTWKPGATEPQDAEEDNEGDRTNGTLD